MFVILQGHPKSSQDIMIQEWNPSNFCIFSFETYLSSLTSPLTIIHVFILLQDKHKTIRIQSCFSYNIIHSCTHP